eukprot:TRINITY_DN8707_c0_g1_i1.p1 TRINITY_DN8707_c0_g1~~TRINITY_DN8707_c0_g1_i1.p1  ORF type:complete len:353 (+),score=52.93 TRINITY_DN8707_c0_g1_i1:79-1137(+)
MEESKTTEAPTHLIVFVHGFLGIPHTVAYLSSQLKTKLGEESLALVSTSNQDFFSGTTQGIPVSGARLSKEITDVVSKTPSLQKISFVGVSLGGLIARYACGNLFDRGTGKIAGLDPTNYVSFASPHLGVRQGVSWWTENVSSKIFIVKRTTDELFLRDAQPERRASSEGYSGVTTLEQLEAHKTLPPEQRPVPLLEEMTIPGGVFYDALASFKHRTLYANVENDHRVIFQTGVIWPFKLSGKTWQRPFTYLKDYPSIVDQNEANFEWTEDKEGYLDVEKVPLEPFYSPDSEEWRMAKNLNKLKMARVSCHFTGFFAMLNHTNIHVGFEALNSQGKNVVEHFVRNFVHGTSD